MNKNILEKNIKTLTNRYMNITEAKLKQYEIDNEDKVHITDTKGGSVLSINHNNQWIFFNSKYRAIDEAKKWAESCRILSNESVILLFGMGNGLMLQHLINEIHPEMEVLIYEPSPQIFTQVISEINLENIFNNPYIHISIRGINETDFMHLLQRYVDYHTMFKTIVINHPKYDNVYTEEYIVFKDMIENRQLINEAQMNFDITFAKAIRMNLYHNMCHTLKGTTTTDYKILGEKNIPAILVSAGPSLNKNVKELHKVYDKAFIIATDTAVKVLLRENIIPHMIITVDARKGGYIFYKQNAQNFAESCAFYGVDPKENYSKWIEIMEDRNNPLKEFDERILNIPVVCSLFSTWVFLNKNQGAKVFYENGFWFLKNLYDLCDKKPGELTTGGSVATTAFSFLCSIGIKKIILIGQDLAYINGARHAEGIYQSSNINVHTAKVNIEIEDIHGEMVYTRRDYYQYLKWFENEIASHSELTVIDATEGGAKIHGTKIMTLAKAIQTYCTQIYDIHQIVHSVKPSFNRKQQQIVYEYIMNTRSRILEMGEILERLLACSEKLLQYINKAEEDESNVSLLHELKEMEKEQQHYIMLINQSKDIEHIFYYMKELQYELSKEKELPSNNELQRIKTRGQYTIKWGKAIQRAIYEMLPDIDTMMNLVEKEYYA